MDIFDLLELIQRDSKHLGFDMRIQVTSQGPTLMIWKRKNSGPGRFIMERRQVKKAIRAWVSSGAHLKHKKALDLGPWIKLYRVLREILEADRK